MILREEIQHITGLSRLALTEAELKKMEKEISSILDLISELETIHAEKVAPMSHPIELKNITREDVSVDSLPEKVDKLIKEIPQKEERFVKVKAVFQPTTDN